MTIQKYGLVSINTNLNANGWRVPLKAYISKHTVGFKPLSLALLMPGLWDSTVGFKPLSLALLMPGLFSRWLLSKLVCIHMYCPSKKETIKYKNDETHDHLVLWWATPAQSSHCSETWSQLLPNDWMLLMDYHLGTELYLTSPLQMFALEKNYIVPARFANHMVVSCSLLSFSPSLFMENLIF